MVKKASELLSDLDRGRVEAAIAAAEAKTSGEIVVVIASRSGRYDRGEDLFGIVTACGFVALGWWMYQGIVPASGAWASGWTPALGLGGVLALIVVGFALGAALATWFPTLGMLFVSRTEQTDDVQSQAMAAFHRFRLRQTDEATGILIYCSLLERMVWVVGDDAISARLDDGAWFNVRDAIIDGFRKRQPGEGLRAGIERAGELLTKHFPLPKGDTNELPNELRFID